MRSKTILVITALLLFNCTALLLAQSNLSLIEKLEQVTKEKEPEWTLDRKLPVERMLVLRWSSGEERIFMSITLTDSSAKAKEVFESSIDRLTERGTKGTRSKIANMGKESEVWIGQNSNGSTELQFRQEKVHVLLFAPSEEVAKRFAGYVSDLLLPAKLSQRETSAQSWKEYSSLEGGFSILFPGNPTQETQVIEPAPGVRLNLRVHVLRTLAEYSVMYYDYPMPVSDPAVAQSVLENGAKGAVASVNSELLEFKEITLDGHPGRYLKERMPSGEIMRVKMLLVGQRLYQVAITTPREDGASAATVKSYAAMADKFLSSFKVTKDRKLNTTV